TRAIRRSSRPAAPSPELPKRGRPTTGHIPHTETHASWLSSGLVSVLISRPTCLRSPCAISCTTKWTWGNRPIAHVKRPRSGVPTLGRTVGPTLINGGFMRRQIFFGFFFLISAASLFAQQPAGPRGGGRGAAQPIPLFFKETWKDFSGNVPLTQD